MSLLFSILYAAHANGTHHKLALDALQHLERPDAEAWRRVFLKDAALYLEGSKAPDTEFKDFKNHVLHVRDGYWGGAPERVEAWYGRTLDALKRGDWAEAVYAAGILSHYVTDPIHPFHTAQSEAETNIHRAVEWSISKSYDALRRQGLARQSGVAIALPGGPAWLKEQVCRGAEIANASYEKLIAHYDFTRGVVDPPAGLDQTGRDVISQLLIYAARSFALVLDKVITESGARPPEVSLTATTVLATLKMPAKWVLNKMADSAERRQVEAMYDELRALGRVDATLTEDDRTVRDLHAREVLAPRAERLRQERAHRVTQAVPAAAARTADPQHPPAAAPPAFAGSPAETGTRVSETAKSAPARAYPTASPIATGRTVYHLKPQDPLEAAPSIGIKMAGRLQDAGLMTVSDLMRAEAGALAAKLGDRRISADTVRDWQDQAQLVMTVPGLRGTHAQLLVGAGYRCRDAIAEADPVALSAAVLKFAGSSEGERVLRSGEAPDIEKIKGWIVSAGLAEAA